MAALIGAGDDLILLRCTPALLNAGVPIQRAVNIHLYRFDLCERVQIARSHPAEVREKVKDDVGRYLRDPSLKSEHFDDDAVTMAAIMRVVDPVNNPLDLISSDIFACFVCNSKANLQVCAQCKSERYCSRACQRQDWRRHKPFCCPIMA